MTFLFRKHGRYGCNCVRGHSSRDVSAYGLPHPPRLWGQLPLQEVANFLDFGLKLMFTYLSFPPMLKKDTN